MNIEDLTINQINEIKDMFIKKHDTCRHIGEKVIVRTKSAGVHYGTLHSKNGEECELSNAIRIWRWAGACSLSQLAMEGVKNPEACKFAMPVNFINLQWIEIIPCTKKARKIIESVKPWKI